MKTETTEKPRDIYDIKVQLEEVKQFRNGLEPIMGRAGRLGINTHHLNCLVKDAQRRIDILQAELDQHAEADPVAKLPPNHPINEFQYAVLEHAIKRAKEALGPGWKDACDIGAVNEAVARFSQLPEPVRGYPPVFSAPAELGDISADADSVRQRLLTAFNDFCVADYGKDKEKANTEFLAALDLIPRLPDVTQGIKETLVDVAWNFRWGLRDKNLTPKSNSREMVKFIVELCEEVFPDHGSDGKMLGPKGLAYDLLTDQELLVPDLEPKTPKIAARDCLAYLVKEMALDRLERRAYMHDHNGKRYTILIIRMDQDGLKFVTEAGNGVLEKLETLAKWMEDFEKPWLASQMREAAAGIIELPALGGLGHNWNQYFSRESNGTVRIRPMDGWEDIRLDKESIPHFVAALLAKGEVDPNGR